jgi:hypothetical protein
MASNDKPAILAQIVITDANKWLDTDKTGVPHSCSIAVGTYASIQEVATALQVALRAIAGNPYPAALVTLDNTGSIPGKVIIDSGLVAGIFKAEWFTGANTANTIGGVLGFDVTADDTGAYLYTSDYQHQRGWYAEYPPLSDSWDEPVIMGGQPFRHASGQVSRATNPNDFDERRVELQLIAKENYHPTYAIGVNTNRDFITLWRWIARLYSFKYISDWGLMTNEGTYGLLQPSRKLDARRLEAGAALYAVSLVMQKSP